MIEEDFEVVSVCPAEPPHDVEGSDWHCYTIVQGTNTIRGYRKGSLGAVTRAVEENVDRLNERRTGKRGRVHLVMPTWKKPEAK